MLFIGLAAATLIPPVRRSVPRWFEAFIWLGLMASGWLTLTNVQESSARFLTDSVTWGAGQVVKVSGEIMLAGVGGWLADHRAGIANTVVYLALLDAFVLAALELRRRAKKSLPRVMLGEWFEFLPVKPAPASTSARHASNEWSLLPERTKGIPRGGFATWFVRAMSWGRNGVKFYWKPRHARSVAGGRPRPE